MGREWDRVRIRNDIEKKLKRDANTLSCENSNSESDPISKNPYHITR